MQNKTLIKIKDFIVQELKVTGGCYCGVMEGDDMVMINSDDGNGNDIAIKITIKPE